MLADLGYATLELDVHCKSVLGNRPEENIRLMTPFLEDSPM